MSAAYEHHGVLLIFLGITENTKNTHYVAKTYCENTVKEAGIPFQSTLPISFSIKTAIYTQIP